MNMTARRARRIVRHRRRGYQVLAAVPKPWGFQLLYWMPTRYGRKPNGVKS